MMSLVVEPTNVCNRNCVHCARDKLEPRESLPLEVMAQILQQAKALGIKDVCLTGGEPVMYPEFEEMIRLIVDYGLKFKMVTNGFQFKDRVLPLLLQPKVRRSFTGVCFSLDGATADSHDRLRGDGSFKEVMEAASLCRLKQIKVSLKSLITNFNKHELTDLALLGATLEAEKHGFIYPMVTPRLIMKKGVIPSPSELKKLIFWVAGSLSQAIKGYVAIEGFCSDAVVFSCDIFRYFNIDYQGNLILCCYLSHTVDDGKPATMGREFLADLKTEPLADGIARHFQIVAQLIADRLKDAEHLNELTSIPCYWCYKYFGKLEWLRNYPESPWAQGVFGESSRD